MTDGGLPRFDGLLFDLFSALLDSQPAYDEVAGSASLGSRWRSEHSRLAYAAGDYRPHDDLVAQAAERIGLPRDQDRKSTRLNSSHLGISYAVFCLKKKIK